MTTRVEYGVQCRIQTFWPRWTNWLSWFRVGRWLLAWTLAADMNSEDSSRYDCGKHRVIKRTITEEEL